MAKRSTKKVAPEGTRITTGGDYVGGNKVTAGGDYAGRDMIKSYGTSAGELAQIFQDIYGRVDRLPAGVDKAEVREAVDAIKEEAEKAVEGKEEPNEKIVKLSAQNIIKMAPDILEVAAAALASPAAGIAAVIRKVIDKAKAEPGG